MFRNSHCAICHLGDDIILTNLEGLENFVGTHNEYFDPATYLGSVDELKYFRVTAIINGSPIEFDVNTNTCCQLKIKNRNELFVGECDRSSPEEVNRKWGSLNVIDDCLTMPFNSVCRQQSGTNVTTRFRYDYICSNRLALHIITNFGGFGGPRSDILTEMVTTPPKYGEFLFSDVPHIPVTTYLETDWINIHENSSICSDGKLKNLQTEELYGSFRLAREKIQVSINII